MFWDRNLGIEESKKEKLSSPQAIPVPVQKYMTEKWKMDPDLLKLLKAVVVKGSAEEKMLHIRIFDGSDALAKKVQVKNYTSLDEHPDLIIYEGQFDERLKEVKLEEKKKVNWDTPIFTEVEIQQKIEALKEPGTTVFFYMARGSANGGPLGMGSSVIELNPNYPGKKQKKYIVYPTNVIDMQPDGKGQKLFDSDKSKDVAHWVKQGHHKREY